MSKSYDGLGRRSADERTAALAEDLPRQVAAAKALAGYANSLAAVDSAQITDVTALATLPVLRKSELGSKQTVDEPFGGFTTRPAQEFAHVFQSPGPGVTTPTRPPSATISPPLASLSEAISPRSAVA